MIEYTCTQCGFVTTSAKDILFHLANIQKYKQENCIKKIIEMKALDDKNLLRFYDSKNKKKVYATLDMSNELYAKLKYKDKNGNIFTRKIIKNKFK